MSCQPASRVLKSILMLQLANNRTRCFRPALAGLMVLLVLFLGLLASNEGAHNKLHQRGTAHDATCAVCAVAKGLVDAPASAVQIASVSPSFAWTVPAFESVLLPTADFSVASSRGPPASFSSL